MKARTVLIVLGVLAIGGVVLYVAMSRRDPVQPLGPGAGATTGGAAGLVSSIGSGVTNIGSAIAGFAEQQEAQADA